MTMKNELTTQQRYERLRSLSPNRGLGFKDGTQEFLVGFVDGKFVVYPAYGSKQGRGTASSLDECLDKLFELAIEDMEESIRQDEEHLAETRAKIDAAKAQLTATDTRVVP